MTRTQAELTLASATASHDNKWEAAYYLVCLVARQTIIQAGQMSDLVIDQASDKATTRLVRYYNPDQDGAGKVVRIGQYAAYRVLRDYLNRCRLGYVDVQQVHYPMGYEPNPGYTVDALQHHSDMQQVQAWQSSERLQDYIDTHMIN